MIPHYWIEENSQAGLRITSDLALTVLGYGRNGRTDQELARQFIDRTSPQPISSDPQFWNTTHKPDARLAHQQFRPTAQRLGVGWCVNGRTPWLADQPDELLWLNGELGQTSYYAPFSKQLPHDPSSIQEIRVAFGLAVTDWTRPFLDLVIWTPHGSILKTYRPDTVLVQDSQLTIRTLWEGLIFPRLETFYDTVLQPELQARQLTITTPPTHAIKVMNPNLTPTDLIQQFN